MGEVLRQLLVKMVSYGLLFKELKEGWKEGWKETNGAKRIKVGGQFFEKLIYATEFFFNILCFSFEHFFFSFK